MFSKVNKAVIAYVVRAFNVTGDLTRGKRDEAKIT